MSSLDDLVRKPDLLLALSAEELSGHLMEHVNSLPVDVKQRLHPKNLCTGIPLRLIPNDPSRELVSIALMEAWQDCERQGLLVPDPNKSGGWCLTTRKGEEFKKRSNADAILRSGLLRRDSLHRDRQLSSASRRSSAGEGRELRTPLGSSSIDTV